MLMKLYVKPLMSFAQFGHIYLLSNGTVGVDSGRGQDRIIGTYTLDDMRMRSPVLIQKDQKAHLWDADSLREAFRCVSATTQTSPRTKSHLKECLFGTIFGSAKSGAYQSENPIGSTGTPFQVFLMLRSCPLPESTPSSRASSNQHCLSEAS